MNRRVPQRSGSSVALPLVLVALLFQVQACESAVTSPTRKEAAAYGESPPSSRESVKFSVYTHCGVESARIGGRWWHATPPREPVDEQSLAGSGPVTGRGATRKTAAPEGAAVREGCGGWRL